MPIQRASTQYIESSRANDAMLMAASTALVTAGLIYYKKSKKEQEAVVSPGQRQERRSGDNKSFDTSSTLEGGSEHSEASSSVGRAVSNVQDSATVEAAATAINEIVAKTGTVSLKQCVSILKQKATVSDFVKLNFPGAEAGSEILARVSKVIEKHGFTDDNTLFAESCCPDEINHGPREIPSLFAEYLGEVFHMGGLAGIPFTGRTGFAAFSHHVPESGHAFILMAPHIGVTDDLRLGKYSREGQLDDGAACGAAVGALCHCCAGKPLPDLRYARGDYQMAYIMHQVNQRLDKIMAAEDENTKQARLATTTHDFGKEMLDEIVNLNFGDDQSSMVILTGVQINMPLPFEGYFQPLTFKRYLKNGTIFDLFEETFGKGSAPGKSDITGTLFNLLSKAAPAE